MKPRDLLDSAALLLSAAAGRPTDVSLRRATSAAYYALFHCLARECADLLIGVSPSKQIRPAWRQVYRSVEHGNVKQQCRDTKMMRNFPKSIEYFGDHFIAMQEKRHAADYDPFQRFVKSEVVADLSAVRRVLEDFARAPKQDRRAFCAYVIFRRR